MKWLLICLSMCQQSAILQTDTEEQCNSARKAIVENHTEHIMKYDDILISGRAKREDDYAQLTCVQGAPILIEPKTH